MHKETPRPACHRPGAFRTGFRAVLTVLLCLALPMTAGADSAVQDQSKSVTLVELYTSQGCSSCPPADAFLQDLSDRSDVLALSFHVDYWNSEGWADPFSDPSFSSRQQAYQDVLGLEYVYTPQMVVGGVFAAPGAQRGAILNAISISKRQAAKGRPELTLRRPAADRLSISVRNAGGYMSSELYAAVFSSSQMTRVKGGETVAALCGTSTSSSVLCACHLTSMATCR